MQCYLFDRVSCGIQTAKDFCGFILIVLFAMRAAKLFVVSGIAIFAIFFLVAFRNLDERADMAGRAALGGFQFCGAAVSIYLLSKGRPDKISLLDWLCSASSVLMACLGLVGSSITYSLFTLKGQKPRRRSRSGCGDGAAAAVAADDMPPQAALSNPRWLGRCASVLDDLGQARDIRLVGNAEA